MTQIYITPRKSKETRDIQGGLTPCRCPCCAVSAEARHETLAVTSQHGGGVNWRTNWNLVVLSREWGNDPQKLSFPHSPIPIHSLLSASKENTWKKWPQVNFNVENPSEKTPQKEKSLYQCSVWRQTKKCNPGFINHAWYQYGSSGKNDGHGYQSGPNQTAVHESRVDIRYVPCPLVMTNIAMGNGP